MLLPSAPTGIHADPDLTTGGSEQQESKQPGCSPSHREKTQLASMHNCGVYVRDKETLISACMGSGVVVWG